MKYSNNHVTSSMKKLKWNNILFWKNNEIFEYEEDLDYLRKLSLEKNSKKIKMAGRRKYYWIK